MCRKPKREKHADLSKTAMTVGDVSSPNVRGEGAGGEVYDKFKNPQFVETQSLSNKHPYLSKKKKTFLFSYLSL